MKQLEFGIQRDVHELVLGLLRFDHEIEISNRRAQHYVKIRVRRKSKDAKGVITYFSSRFPTFFPETRKIFPAAVDHIFAQIKFH